MSYRIVSTIVQKGPNLRRRLEASVASEIARARADELDQAKDRILDGGSPTHRAAIPEAVRVVLDKAEQAARTSALAYEAANRDTTKAETHAPARVPALQAVEAAALVTARALETAALDARVKAKTAIPPEMIAHVLPQFDLQIKEALDETAARTAKTDGANVISFEMSGHVEDVDHFTRGWWNVEVPAPKVRMEGWHPSREGILMPEVPRMRMSPLRTVRG
jgi:hypothetical protein